MNPARWWPWAVLAAAAAALLWLAPPPPDAYVVQSLARGSPPAALLAAPPAVPPAAQTVGPINPAPAVLRMVPRIAEPEGTELLLWPADVAPVAAPAPAVPASVAVPVPAPAAPALPWRLLGRYAEGEKAGVVLQAPDGQLFVAHAGEPLGDDYRVESVAGNIMVLTYLPLNQRQTMDIGIAQ